MQKSFVAITPQKKTAKHHLFEEHLKELSPLMLTVFSSSYGKMSKLEMMQSPAPTSKDLFYQLLASEIKAIPQNYAQNYEILDESEDSMDFKNSRQMLSEQQSDQFEENQYEEDENGVKKRKRKSTNQIKMLKLQLDAQPNWNKEKIAEMSQVTGLSQSQVYKWWWDQKKKNMKNENESIRMANKRKIIRKDFNHNHKASFGKYSSYEQMDYNAIQTKPKQVVQIEQLPQTEKKVNKRLIF